MPILSLDFETFCTLDLKQTGADLYAASPTLVVTVIAWAFDDNPVRSIVWPDTSTLPGQIETHLAESGTLRAWNAAFEWAVLSRHYGVTVPWQNVDCTMQRAMVAGFPASLDHAGMAMELPASLRKDTAIGHGLMLRMSRPRSGGGLWHEDDPARLARLEAYCRQDVVAERAIARRLKPLPSREKEVSVLDHETNQRGIGVDLALIHKLADLARAETAHLSSACGILTNGDVTAPASQLGRLKAWLVSRGVPVPDEKGALDKEGVAYLLEDDTLPDDVRQVLLIRLEVAKASAKKLVSMTRCAGPDSRVRGQLRYYGAARTGRFAGTLIQVQNFPRPSLPKADLAVAVAGIKQGSLDRDGLDLIYGQPLAIVAQALRSCLVPAPGRVFISFDLRQIEARVLAWLAGAHDTLKAFADGEDVYVREQQRIRLPSRLAGKVVTLAAGFGMGPKRFRETAAAYGLDLDEKEAEKIIHDWRDANPEITSLWYRTEDTARQAIRSRGSPIAVNQKLSFTGKLEADGKITLAMTLPSSRHLYYRNVRTLPRPVPPGEPPSGRTELTYNGVQQNTKRWDVIKTWGGKLVENAVQAIARDCLVDAALRIDRAGLGKLVLSVHDELVLEADHSGAEARAALILAEIEKSPTFAPDLPIGAEGGIKSSYGV